MVPENEFHHKEQPVRSATPASQQNGPGNTGKPAAGKTDEGSAEDAGEFPAFPPGKVALVSLFIYFFTFRRDGRQPRVWCLNHTVTAAWRFFESSVGKCCFLKVARRSIRWRVCALFSRPIDRSKEKSQGSAKPANKTNSTAARVTTSNGNGAPNR